MNYVQYIQQQCRDPESSCKKDEESEEVSDDEQLKTDIAAFISKDESFYDKLLKEGNSPIPSPINDRVDEDADKEEDQSTLINGLFGPFFKGHLA